MKLIVGLGNPGEEYIKTRHNIGFQLLDLLASKYNLIFKKDKKYNSLYCDFTFNGEKIMIIKPLSYMNLSGKVVGKYSRFYNIESENILVIQDDLDMDFGKIRILFDSTSGGHNGIQNIIDNIGTQRFVRLKIGISNNKYVDTKDYVLGKFSDNDLKLLNGTYEKLINIIEDFANYNIQELKQIYNNKNNN